MDPIEGEHAFSVKKFKFEFWEEFISGFYTGKIVSNIVSNLSVHSI